MANTEEPLRHLHQVEVTELYTAVKKMCAELNIPLSDNSANVWQAVFEEYLRSRQFLTVNEELEDTP